MNATRDVTEEERAGATAVTAFDPGLMAALFEEMEFFVYIVDPGDSRILYMNTKARNFWGPGTGKRCYEVLHTLDQFCPSCDGRIFRLDRSYSIEFQDADCERWFRRRSQMINWSGERAVRLEIAVDITRQKQLQEHAVESEARVRSLLQDSPNLILMINAEGTIQYANREIAEMGPDDVLGRSIFDFIAVDFCNEVREAILSVFDGAKSARHSFRVSELIGVNAWYDVSIWPVSIFGEIVSVTLFAIDVTEQKEMETQLLQSQKLESIGQLAAGIAHEINTPTQFVGDNTKFLQTAFEDISIAMEKYKALMTVSQGGCVHAEQIDQVKKDLEESGIEFILEEIPEAIEHTLTGVSRVAEIVQAMKDFSHPGVDKKTMYDINTAISSTVTVCRNEWKYVADMNLDLADDLPSVPCLPGELGQSLLNLIVNAAHAIAEKQKSSGDREKGTISVSSSVVGDFAEIRVSDTGAGIPERIRERIMDPFFTTKESGKGTGQGLAITRSVIVEKHGGRLSFESEEGEGTTFIIGLPLSDDAAESDGSP